MTKTRQRAYLVAGLACVLVLGALIMIVQKLQFDGDLVSILRSDSVAQARFERLQTDFQPFSSDEILLLETDTLSEPARLDALREIVIELQLIEDVAGVLSIFSLPDPQDGRPVMAPVADTPPSDLLARLDIVHPAARQLISDDRALTLVIVMPEDREGLAPDSRLEAQQIVAEFGEGAFHASFIGLPEAYRHLQHALLEDQLRLLPFATVISLLVAALLFRSWRVAVLCTVPALAGLVVFLGLLPVLQLQVTTLISLAPLLVLVLGIAHTQHLYLAMRDAIGTHPETAVQTALADVAPACIFSSLTTAIAFATFAATGFGALEDLALAGIAGLAVQTAAVLTLAPALAVLLRIPEHVPPAPPVWLSAPIAPALRLRKRRVLVIAVCMIALGAALWGHLAITPGHSLREHLLRDGTVAQAEARIDGRLAGTGQRFLVLEDPDGMPGLSAADLAALAPIVSLFEDLGAALPEGDALNAVREMSVHQMTPVMRRFVSGDALAYAVPLFTPLVEPAAGSLERAEALQDRLIAAGFDDRAYVSGLSHHAALEIPRMIDALKSGLFLTVLLVSAVVTLVARSLWLGFAALVVNALPVLGIEALLWFAQAPLTMTAAVALTIAFGVAVDDSLHMLNRYRIERNRNGPQAVARCLHLVGVPIATSTLLIVACLAVTQASLLPSVATFGLIVCGAMVLAYLADMFLLPAFLSDR